MTLNMYYVYTVYIQMYVTIKYIHNSQQLQQLDITEHDILTSRPAPQSTAAFAWQMPTTVSNYTIEHTHTHIYTYIIHVYNYCTSITS